jgi:FkbM family methyltransferase
MLAATPLRDVHRGVRLFAKSLSACPGFKAKLSMCRCLAGWIRSRLGRPGSPHELTLSLRDLRVRIDITRYEILPFWELWFEHEYELLPAFRATSASIVVDIGGSIGFYAIRQAQRALDGRVLTFEPSPAVFRRLIWNLEANRLSNVIPVNEAVGSIVGTVNLTDSIRSINCHIVPDSGHATVPVSCTTLDAVASRFGLNRIDILKIDTEGHERAVLTGAIRTLPRVERIVLELHGDIAAERRAIDTILRPFGFRFAAQRRSIAYYDRSPVA